MCIFQYFYIINKCYFINYVSYLVSTGVKMILLSRFIYDEEIRNLRQEIKKLREENLNLKNRLEDSINDRFELTCKLKNINNYIIFLEGKLKR